MISTEQDFYLFENLIIFAKFKKSENNNKTVTETTSDKQKQKTGKKLKTLLTFLREMYYNSIKRFKHCKKLRRHCQKMK